MGRDRWPRRARSRLRRALRGKGPHIWPVFRPNRPRARYHKAARRYQRSLRWARPRDEEWTRPSPQRGRRRRPRSAGWPGENAGVRCHRAYADKKKPIREAYADRRVRERCQTRKSKKRRHPSPLRTTLVLLLRGLLRLLLCWHQWITSSWPLIDGYIDTLTSLMSTELTGKSSSGRRGNVAPQSLRDAASELRRSDIGGAAVADDLQESLLEREVVAAVG